MIDRNEREGDDKTNVGSRSRACFHEYQQLDFVRQRTTGLNKVMGSTTATVTLMSQHKTKEKHKKEVPEKRSMTSTARDAPGIWIWVRARRFNP
jgi:hypothetical protein